MPSSFTSFIRYNLSAGLATLIDFVILITLTEVFNLWYIFSAVAGAVSGGLLAFVVERNWVFNKKHGNNVHKQALKYAGIWITSIVLNTSGLFALVEYFNMNYIIAKVIVAVLIGVGFNFISHKYYIFN
jgi:putative flippase GtrA